MFIALERWIASSRCDGKTRNAQRAALIDWLLAEPKKKTIRPRREESSESP